MKAIKDINKSIKDIKAIEDIKVIKYIKARKIYENNKKS